jgi:hypothetical protein
VSHPLNFVMILGAARGGKSTLMSLMCGKPGLFASSSGGDSFTKGIHMANYFLDLELFSRVDNGAPVRPATEERVLVGFVDAEGQGDRGVEYDLKLIAAPMLLSKIIIFNWSATMQKNKILDELMVMTEVALKYRDVSSTSKPFSYLAIVFQNCKEQEISEGEQRRFDKLFAHEDVGDLEEDKDKELRNKTRKRLRGSFEDIQCFLFPPPVENKALYEKSGGLAFEDLTDAYRCTLGTFRAELAARLREPHSFTEGQPLAGPDIASMASTMAPKISKDESFVPSSLFQSMEQNNALQEAQQEAAAKTAEAEAKAAEAEVYKQRIAQLEARLQEETSPGLKKQLSRQLSQAQLQHTNSMQQGPAKDDEVQAAEPSAPTDMADGQTQEFVEIVTQTLLDRLGLPEQARDMLQTLATAACPALPFSQLQQCLQDPKQIMPTLLAWSKESPQCGQALPPVEAALRRFLRGRTEGVTTGRVRAAALKAVSDFTLTPDHVLMLLEGDLFELVKDVLGSAAAAALDELTADLQRKVEHAVDVAERVEQSAEAAKDVIDSIGTMVGEDSVATEAFEKLLEIGRNTPVFGSLFVAIDGLYKMLKGAKTSRAAYAPSTNWSAHRPTLSLLGSG